ALPWKSSGPGSARRTFVLCCGVARAPVRQIATSRALRAPRALALGDRVSPSVPRTRTTAAISAGQTLPSAVAANPLAPQLPHGLLVAHPNTGRQRSLSEHAADAFFVDGDFVDPHLEGFGRGLILLPAYPDVGEGRQEVGIRVASVHARCRVKRWM